MSLTQHAELSKAPDVEQEAASYRLTAGGEALLELHHLREQVFSAQLSAGRWDVVHARCRQPKDRPGEPPSGEQGWAIDPRDGCGQLWTPHRAEAERMARMHNRLVQKVDELASFGCDDPVRPDAGAEDALDQVLRRADDPGVAGDDLVQAVVELLDEATLSPAQSDRVERARKQALDRWSLSMRRAAG